MNRPCYYVSRQAYWPTGEKVVEIAAGGLNYSNPGQLSDPKDIYGIHGDRTEYEDPRKALAAAVAIRDEWQKHTDEEIRVEAGFTHGFTAPFNEHPTDDELREWAEKEHAYIEEHAEKCVECGDPIYGEDWWEIPELGEDFKFCSEQCCDDYFYTEYLDATAERQIALA